MAALSDLTVVVPVRNAEHWIESCLESIARSGPREIIVVDGLSTDRTVELARSFGARILSDDGEGVAVARHLGVEAANTPYVALVDVDVVLPDGALASLLGEFTAGGYTGLQAGLHSVSEPGYWGRALAAHHRSGRSKHWFGVVATIFEREALLEHGFDERFKSGEDIDLRWRLQRAGAKIGVSRATVVEHRFGSSWEFAKDQWLADGRAGARMMGAHGLRSLAFLALPLAATVRGIGLSLVRLQPQWLPYYLCYCLYNYIGLTGQLLGVGAGGDRRLSIVGNSLALVASRVAAMALGFGFWLLAARLFPPAEVGLAAAVVAAMMLCTNLAQMGLGSAVIARLPRHREQPGPLIESAITLSAWAATAGAVLFLVVASVALAELGAVARDPVYAFLFVGTAVLGTLGLLLEQTSTALRRGDQALTRALAFGATTLFVLLVLQVASDSTSSTLLFAPWFAAAAVAFAMGLRQLRRTLGGYRTRMAVRPALGRELFRTGLPNHALTLAERAPGLVLPIVVTELVSPGDNAVWYAVWMMAWVVFIVPIQVGMAMFAEIAEDVRRAATATRRGVTASLAIGVPAALVVVAAADPLLSLMGPSYAESGVAPLRILVLGFLPLTVISAYYAACRARDELAEPIVAGWIAAVASVAVPAAAGVSSGLDAMALAWVLVQVLMAVWAAARILATSQATVAPHREAPAAVSSSG